MKDKRISTWILAMKSVHRVLKTCQLDAIILLYPNLESKLILLTLNTFYVKRPGPWKSNLCSNLCTVFFIAERHKKYLLLYVNAGAMFPIRTRYPFQGFYLSAIKRCTESLLPKIDCHGLSFLCKYLLKYFLILYKLASKWNPYYLYLEYKLS